MMCKRDKLPIYAEECLEALKDKQAFVRDAAAEELGELGIIKRVILEELFEALADIDCCVRSAAARSLAKLLLPNEKEEGDDND
jgi:HEAT repeat protein